MFTKEELYELKISLNELIRSRQVYAQLGLSEEEIEFTVKKLKFDYGVLDKVLKLIEEEN